MKKTFRELDFEFIKELLEVIYGKEEVEKNFKEVKISTDEKKAEDKNELPLWATKVEKEKKKHFVSTILYCNQDLPIKPEPSIVNSPAPSKFSFKSLFGKASIASPPTENPNSLPNTLFIFIHGGGFYKMSSSIYEGFLRNFSISLNIPVMGINYHGIPQYPYPYGLNECLQAYLWILENCEKEIGFKPEKIILSGDSAGGNYALALTNILIALNLKENKNSYKIPDFLLPVYPACSFVKGNMSLSLSLSINDSILNAKSSGNIGIRYRGRYPNDLDSFLSQITANDKLIKNYPKSRFFIASHDPLRDDCIRLLYKMCLIEGINVKAYDFEFFPHGFLNHQNETIRLPGLHVYMNELKEFLGIKEEGENANKK